MSEILQHAKHPTPQKDFNLNLNKAGEISGAEAPCWARPAGMVSFVFVKVIEGKFSAGRTTTDVVVPPTDIEVTSELTFYGLLGHALADRSQKYLGSSDEQGGGAVVVCTMHSTIEPDQKINFCRPCGGTCFWEGDPNLM